jgi:MSHA biogenesis protein MshM
MIKQTYGITKVPFLQSELKLLPHQQEIADLVNIHSQHGGLCIITGDPGVGKTVIKSSIEKQAQKKDHLIISLSRTMDIYSKIIQQVGESLEIEVSHRKIEKDILKVVHEQARSNKTIITVIDEAHLLEMESLRKLQLLFDHFPRRHNLILLGQSELMVRLSLKNNQDIKSRITYSKQLKPLCDEDLMAFIQIESDAVKLPKNTFEDGALELIFRSVQGNLRLCANLSFASLLEACRQGDRVVDHTHVNAILIQPHWRSHEDLITGDVPA